MDCTACGHTNSEGAKFCSQCGTAVTRACASCGHELAPDARFCEQCGTAAGGPSAPPTMVDEPDDTAVRKTVTVLFADLVGSTAFGERVDAESTRDVLAQYHSMARSVIEEHGGFLAKFIGDGVMALFGVPETAEDDATRAIAAGVALQTGFEPLRDLVARQHGADLRLRVGINTGEVVIADGDADVVGDALNTAARLEAACSPGRVLVGEDTWRLTRSAIEFEELGTVEVKGKAGPVATYQVLAAGPDDDDSGTPFVGRVGELSRLRDVFDAAVSGRSARLATVVGAPGVGKTRLARELCLDVDDVATVIEMRCRRSGTATFAPVADLLRSSADLGEHDSPDETRTAVRRLVHGLSDADRVADLLTSFVGIGGDRSTEEAFFAVRRLFESQARRQPVVIVVDDIQWAEPLFLDLLEHLAEWVDDAPMLVLALARPEIREIRPALATEGRLVQVAIALEGLDADATAELAAKLVGAAELPAELIGRLPQSTEGNPLFVRELMRMLVDDGVIVESGSGWELTIEAEAVEVPPTIQSLLSARLDRMLPDERRLVELASVVGSEFPLGAVAAISEPGTDLHSLRTVLDRLRRRELVESAGRYRGDEPVFRFHHVLIRDAAYRRLLKRRRADLHARVGEWTERTAVDLPGEHGALIAFHFEQAFAYRRELSDLDEETTDLGRRAAGLLRVAAERAFDRDDIAAAGALVERAVACLDTGEPELPDLLKLGCEALLSLGDVSRSRSLVGALAALGGDDRQAAWTSCFQAQLTVLTEPGTLHDVLRRLDTAADDLTRLGDDAGVAKARLVRAGALARLGRIGESESELDLALTAARAADDRRRVAAVLGVAPVAALWGPSPIPRAGGRCLDVIRLLRITTGSPSVEAVSTRCQAVLEALRGRFDTARTMLAEARATVEELGLRHEVLETQMYAGIVELLADEPAAAEPPLRDAYKGLADLGIDADAGQAAAYLARALLRLGRVDEADELAGASDALAGQTPQTGIVARSVQAEVLAAQGHSDVAVQIAREAVEIASATDLVIDHADANAVLAAVATDPAESAAARDAATHLYDSKAATLPPSLASHRAPPASDPIERESSPVPPDDTVDEDAAHASLDEPWNRAADTHERYFRLHLVGEWEQAHSFFADDVVIDDRRNVVGVHYTGQQEYNQAYDTWTFDPARSTARTLATRGDDLAVRRCLRSSDDREVEHLAVVHVDSGGRIDHVVSFDAGDLRHAIDEFYRQYEAELVAAGDLEALLDHRGTADHREAIVDRDIDRYYAFQDPSGEIVDHRPVGWGTLSIAESHERLATLRDLAGDLETYVARVIRSERNVSLIEQVLQSTSPQGGVSEESSLFLVRERAGLVVRIEQFHVGQIDAALRAFDQQHALTRADGAANAASMVGDYVNASLTAWGRLRPVLLSPECSVVGTDGAALSGDLGSFSDVDRLRSLGVGVSSHRTLGLWGERIALVELRDDDVDGAPFHRIAVEEIDDHARLCSITLFEPTIDGLRAAVELAIDRTDEITPQPPVVQMLHAMADAGRDDVGALRSYVSAGFEQVDHREMGFGSLTAEAYLELMSSSDEIMDELHVPQGFFHATDRGLVTKLANIVVRPNGELDIAAPMCMVFVFDDEGRVVRQELFEESDEDTALSRLEELTGEPTSRSDEPWNRADAWCRSGWVSYTGHDREGWRSHLSDDIVLDDRRPLIGGESAGRDTLIERMWAISDAKIDDSWLTTVATRGDRLVLQRHGLRTDDGTTWDFLAVYLLGDDHRVARMTVFDGEALAEAIDELDRLFLDEPDSPLEALVVRRAAAVHRAFREGDVEALESMSTQSAHRTDHSPLGWGAMGSAGMDERRRSLFDLDVDFYLYLARVHWVDPHCVCFGVHRITWPADGSEYESSMLVVEDIDKSTEENVGHMFDGSQVDEAIATARARSDSFSEPANAASAIFGALHMWQRLGRPAVHAPHFADDFEVIGSEGGSTVGGRADVLVDDAPAWMGASRRVLVVHGDHASLVQLRSDGSPGQKWFAVEWICNDGALLGVALFPHTTAGLARAAQRIVSQSLLHETVPTLVQELAEAGLDVDRLAGLLDPGFEFCDRRTLGYPRADRTTYLEIAAAIGHAERGVLLPLELLVSNHRGTVGTTHEFTVRDDGELADSGRSVFVTAVGDFGISAIERFPADEIDAAIARFEELTQDAHTAFDNLARRVGARMVAAMNDGTLLDRLDELFAPGWVRVDHRTVVNSGTLDAKTVAESTTSVEAHGTTTPIANRGDCFTLSRGTTRYGPDTESTYLVLSEVDDSARQTRVDFYDEDALDDAMAELDRRWFDSLPVATQNTATTSVRWRHAAESWDVDAFESLMSEDFEAYEVSRLGPGHLDREEFLSMQEARGSLQGRFERYLFDLAEFPRPDVILTRSLTSGTDSRWGTKWNESFIVVFQVVGDRVRRFGRFDYSDLEGARMWAGSLDAPTRVEPAFDSAARRMALRIERAMNDGTLADRIEEFYDPDFERVDHRTVIGTGVIDMTTYVENVPEFYRGITHVPVAERGDRFLLQRATLTYDGDNESRLLVLGELSEAGRERRTVLFDEDALEDAMAELDRRWYESLGAVEQQTVIARNGWGAARRTWDLDAFDELMSADFEGYDGTRLGPGPMTRAQFLSSQQARGELQGSDHQSLIDLVEMPRPDVILSRVQSSGHGELHGAEWENQWIVVHQAVDGHIRRFGLFDHDDLDEARTWAASLDTPGQIDPVFDNLAMRATVRFETAVNDGTLSEHLDDWYEPDFQRIDRRTVIGTGTLDLDGYVESIPDFFDSITHVPVAVRGERFLLAQATMQHGGGNGSELLVLVEMGETGRERRTILFDTDALDDAMTELDRRWARTLTAEERTTLKVSGEYMRAWIEQDYGAFERIVHPDFRNTEHVLFGNEEADLDAMRAAHADANSVFGSRAIIVDHIELPTPDIVLVRHSSSGTSPTDVEWEISEWSILQVRDGRVLRNEVFDVHPEGDAESHARQRVKELVERAERGNVENRAVRVAEAVFSSWTAGDTAADRFAAEFERLDRRAVVSAPDVGRDELLSTVLPEILALRPRCEISDVLLAYDDALALVRARMASEDGPYEVEYLMAEACDDDGRLVRTAIFDLGQEDEARRELTRWWAPTLSRRRLEVSRLAVAFGESWVAPTAHPFDDLLAPDFALVDGRTLGLGELDRDGFVQALIGREDDGTTGPPVPSRVRFTSDDVLVFRAANRGITPGTEIEWEEIACNVLAADGPVVRRVEMFDEDQWDAAITRAREIADADA